MSATPSFHRRSSSSRATTIRVARGAGVLMLTALLVCLTGWGTAGARELNSGCDHGSFISNIELEDHGFYGTKIKVTPTNAARLGSGPGSDLTNPMWSAVQSCVPGLYGSVADSIYQQLDCHVLGGQFEIFTGPTWDLETWLVPLDNPNLRSYAESHCLNEQPIQVNDFFYLA